MRLVCIPKSNSYAENAKGMGMLVSNYPRGKQSRAVHHGRILCCHVTALTFMTFIAYVLAIPVSAQSASEQLAPGIVSQIDGAIDDIIEPHAEITVPRRQSKLIRTSKDLRRISAADPSVVDIVAFDTREIELIGLEAGATSMTLWLGEGEEAEVLSFLVRVEADKLVNERRRLEYGELEDSLNELFPGSKIRLFPVSDKIVVKGYARDSEEAERILAMIRQQGGGGASAGAQAGVNGISAQGTAVEPYPDGSTVPESTIISMLTIPGEQQVMLKVRMAELNRTAARRLGVNLTAEVKEFLFRSALMGATGGNMFFNGTFSESNFLVAVQALEEHGVAKILAQPNLVTLSGQTATFIAGGEFPVPTVVGIDGVGAATTHFQGYGTQLLFTPTIIDKDRIRLQVTPTFSQINQNNSVNGIPGLDTRSASTTVDLREGQVFAIAGLIQDTQVGTRARVPGLGIVPGLGWFFNAKETTRGETELIIIVSPEIVSALNPEDAPPLLPGMEMTEPNDFDFYIRSQIEGRPCDNYRSTIWPKYRDLLIHPRLNAKTVRQSEGYYCNGPTGLSE